MVQNYMQQYILEFISKEIDNSRVLRQNTVELCECFTTKLIILNLLLIEKLNKFENVFSFRFYCFPFYIFFQTNTHQ